MELPPRTRRIRSGEFPFPRLDGTTSAYAENTKEGREFDGVLGNYLRVRGEYAGAFVAFYLQQELPPRTRRIPTAWVF